jgi:hypothetical protein
LASINLWKQGSSNGRHNHAETLSRYIPAELSKASVLQPSYVLVTRSGGIWINAIADWEVFTPVLDTSVRNAEPLFVCRC